MSRAIVAFALLVVAAADFCASSHTDKRVCERDSKTACTCKHYCRSTSCSPSTTFAYGEKSIGRLAPGPWVDHQGDPASRAQALLAHMSLQEKVHMLHGSGAGYGPFLSLMTDRTTTLAQ